jgi:hypothetical protein
MVFRPRSMRERPASISNSRVAEQKCCETWIHPTSRRMHLSALLDLSFRDGTWSDDRRDAHPIPSLMAIAFASSSSTSDAPEASIDEAEMRDELGGEEKVVL